MFFPTSKTTRRQFLERSALGAGSVLFLPTLLESCMTDHTLPSPVTDPPTLGLHIDWNDDAKSLVITALGLVPEAGGILSGLVNYLWPSTKEDIWGEIKAQVEALINKKIAAKAYQDVSDDLKGLNNSTILYLNEIKNGNTVAKLTQWMITRNAFAQALPHFQSKGYEVLLLPMFAQFANMYLSILRDGVAFGKSWGRTEADHQQDIADLKKAIDDFVKYGRATIAVGRADREKTAPDVGYAFEGEPYRTLNQYDRHMTLTVNDYVETWFAFDADLYSTGKEVVLTREIYSDPKGGIDKGGPFVIDSPPPTQFPSQITVWGWDELDAVQLTYPASGGPGGITQTPRMGDQPNGSRGGSNQAPHGGIFNILPNNPIVAVRTVGEQWTGVLAMWLQFYDGTVTYMLGGLRGLNGAVDNTESFANEALSSMHVHGTSQKYGSIDMIVFGFKYWVSPEATLKTIQNLYITNPTEQSAADFIKISPTLSATPISDDLKAARQAYWASIQARAEALK